MTRPRSTIVSLHDTPYYHCISRCVRRAFLCGKDRYTRKSFEHRKPWLVARIKLLAEIFAIDIAAYAVMSNHYHLVLHVDRQRASNWSEEEVIQRWRRLYKGPVLVQRYLQGEAISTAERAEVSAIAEVWRSRLANLSWFMACLNEYMARKANAEDGCTGRFWEGRFKSQALLDSTALLSCMAYVDLNPVRANMADSLECSHFTSIQTRIRNVRGLNQKTAPALMPFSESKNLDNDLSISALPFHLKEYLALVDWTGRIVRKGKRGALSEQEPDILRKLGISGTQWHYLALEIQKRSITLLHGLDKLAALDKQRTRNKAA